MNFPWFSLSPAFYTYPYVPPQFYNPVPQLYQPVQPVDPWLKSFVERNAPSAPPGASSWSQTAVIKKMQSVLALSSELQALAAEAEATTGKACQHIIDQAAETKVHALLGIRVLLTRTKRKLEAESSVFRQTSPDMQRFKVMVAKRRRHKALNDLVLKRLMLPTALEAAKKKTAFTCRENC